MVRPTVPFALIALSVLAVSCANPCASCRIDAFVGQGIAGFMKESGLKPQSVQEVQGGKTYVFEIDELIHASVPPQGAAPGLGSNRAANVGVNPAALQTRGTDPTSNRNMQNIQEGPALVQAPVIRTHLLTVLTAPDGTIRSYTCTEG